MSNERTEFVACGVAMFGEMHPPARTAALEAATDPAVPAGRMRGLTTEFVFGRIWATLNGWTAGRAASSRRGC